MKVLKFEPSNTGDMTVIICGQRVYLESNEITAHAVGRAEFDPVLAMYDLKTHMERTIMSLARAKLDLN